MQVWETRKEATAALQVEMLVTAGEMEKIVFKLHLGGKISLGWVVCGSEAESRSKMILLIHCGNQRSFS